MCKKQTPVSHSSTALEIIPLDAGMRMECNPALDLWDVMTEVKKQQRKFLETGAISKRQQENCLHMSNITMKVTRMLNSCHVYFTYPQTKVLLSVKRSCSFLKTTKQ